ncbi:unnamed protein product [Lactuca virosa]|uniref:Uncharacterized protein n=1 Tax=Lactuca virosa TaxID=75947 RepID=A0AAU9NM40_9ASTR|nr:unnamed protein product [Lactuca virosa]
MLGPVKQRQQQMMGSFRNSAMREKEDELGLFLEMRKREKERHDVLLHNAEEEFDSSLGSRTGNSPKFSVPSATSMRKTGADEFLNSESDKNDYDWLLTPPGTPLFPSLESESQKTVMNQNGASKAHHPNAPKSRLSNTQPEAVATRTNMVSRQRAASPGPSAGPRRPTSSGGSGSRPSTPTSRPVLGTSSSRTTSNSLPKTTTVSKPTSRPTRSSTPTTSRPVISSSKATAPPRSSTPTSRATPRSSTPTPTSRPSLSTAKPTPRASTPTRKPTTVTKTPAPPVKSPTVKNTTQALATTDSPNTRPRPWKPQEMPGYTLDAPPNLRTSLTDRPISSIRGRAGGPSSRSSSIEPVPNGRGVRRQSCSPSRGRLPNGVNATNGMTRKSGASVPIPALNRAYAKANDNMSPGSYGTKMVERVINMRKLIPPKQDDKHSPHNLSGKSSSPDSSGFGRSLSKKSLDMAMRHMDIRKTVPGNLRPLMTKIPASSMYSVRSGNGPGPTRGRMISVSDSPLATSSNASSEMSVNNNNAIDEHIEDESNSEKGTKIGKESINIGRRYNMREGTHLIQNFKAF